MVRLIAAATRSCLLTLSTVTYVPATQLLMPVVGCWEFERTSSHLRRYKSQLQPDFMKPDLHPFPQRPGNDLNLLINHYNSVSICI